jgi:hypothetical protein
MSSLDHSVLERLGALLQQRLSLVGLAAFGSRVRHDSAAIENDSDLDVLVISETLTPDVRRIVSDCAFEAGFDAGILVSPVVYSHEEWEHSPEGVSPLAESIRHEGVFLTI